MPVVGQAHRSRREHKTLGRQRGKRVAAAISYMAKLANGQRLTALVKAAAAAEIATAATAAGGSGGGGRSGSGGGGGERSGGSETSVAAAKAAAAAKQATEAAKQNRSQQTAATQPGPATATAATAAPMEQNTTQATAATAAPMEQSVGAHVGAVASSNMKMKEPAYEHKICHSTRRLASSRGNRVTSRVGARQSRGKVARARARAGREGVGEDGGSEDRGDEGGGGEGSGRQMATATVAATARDLVARVGGVGDGGERGRRPQDWWPSRRQ